MVNVKGIVFMYRAYNKIIPANIMPYFKKSMSVTITMSVCKIAILKSSLVELLNNLNVLV